MPACGRRTPGLKIELLKYRFYENFCFKNNLLHCMCNDSGLFQDCIVVFRTMCSKPVQCKTFIYTVYTVHLAVWRFWLQLLVYVNTSLRLVLRLVYQNILCSKILVGTVVYMCFCSRRVTVRS